MRPVTVTRTMVAAAVGAIAALQTTAGAGNLLINGTLASGGVATLDTQRTVGLTSAGNLSAVNFTLTGTDQQGRVISEVLAGPNANTVSSVLNYKTITSIAVSAAVGTNVTADTVTTGSSQEIPIDLYVNQINITLATELTGAANYTVQYTMDNVFGGAGPFNWNTVAGLLAQTTNQVVQLTQAVRALRLLTNSGTGTVALIVTQAGLAGI
jgi:hypothetical protein